MHSLPVCLCRVALVKSCSAEGATQDARQTCVGLGHEKSLCAKLCHAARRSSEEDGDFFF